VAPTSKPNSTDAVAAGPAGAAPAPADTANPIIPLGMHRSGTSLLASLCHHLGVAFGDALIPARADNPRGFWEDPEVVAADEAIFALFGLNSQDVLPLPPGWLDHPELPGQQQRLVERLAAALVGPRPWGVKDPRMARLMPVWHAVFAALGVTPRFVIPLRPPGAVAASLVARDHVSTERGLLLWLEHNLELEYHTRGHARVFVELERLLAEPVAAAERIADGLGCAWPRRPDDVAAALTGQVEPALRHHDGDDGALPQMVTEAFAALRAHTDGTATAATDRALDRVRDDLWRLLGPPAETLYALQPPAGIWRQTVEQQRREIDHLRARLRANGA